MYFPKWTERTFHEDVICSAWAEFCPNYSYLLAICVKEWPTTKSEKALRMILCSPTFHLLKEDCA